MPAPRTFRTTERFQIGSAHAGIRGITPKPTTTATSAKRQENIERDAQIAGMLGLLQSTDHEIEQAHATCATAPRDEAHEVGDVQREVDRPEPEEGRNRGRAAKAWRGGRVR